MLSPSKHEWGDSFDGETNTCVAYLHFDKLSANGLPNLNAIALHIVALVVWVSRNLLYLRRRSGLNLRVLPTYPFPLSNTESDDPTESRQVTARQAISHLFCVISPKERIEVRAEMLPFKPRSFRAVT